MSVIWRCYGCVGLLVLGDGGIDQGLDLVRASSRPPRPTSSVTYTISVSLYSLDYVLLPIYPARARKSIVFLAIYPSSQCKSVSINYANRLVAGPFSGPYNCQIPYYPYYSVGPWYTSRFHRAQLQPANL